MRCVVFLSGSSPRATIFPFASERLLFTPLRCPSRAQYAGILAPNSVPWSSIEEEWTFVDTFAGYSIHVTGDENMERFKYWENMFFYFRQMAIVSCELHSKSSNLTMETEKMINYFMASMGSKGSLGTLTNIQQQLFPLLIFPAIGDDALPADYTG